jgi:hypothetical protein
VTSVTRTGSNNIHLKMAIYEGRNMLLLVTIQSASLTLTLMEEQRLRMPENRVLRRTFGPKMAEIITGWKKIT